MTSAHRRVAAWTALVGIAGLVVVTLWRVPLDPSGATLRLPDPRDYFTAAQLSRGEDYAGWARTWSLAATLVSLAVACLLGFTTAGPRMVARLRGPWWVRAVAAVTVLLVAGRVVTLPFAVLLRRRQLEFGLSEQPWSGFAADLVRTEVVQVVATSLAVVVLLLVARRWRRAWPAIAGVALGVLVLLGSFVYPLLVEPVFNHFTPLPDGSLRSGVLALADREGVVVDDVLVADASRRTTTLNAYVSGFGSTRRVVLYDNLVDDLPEDEALSVVAHELTHARQGDVLTGSVLGAFGALTAAGLLGLLVGDSDRSGRRLEPGDVPRVFALLTVATLLVSPVENAVSRRIETRADLGALTATRDPAASIGLQQQLATRSVADLTPPGAWQWWFGSHPTTLQRIALALRVQDRGASQD